MIDSRVYKKLRLHLDSLPGGFRPAENNADIRLLQNLFTSEEAELATNLKLKREDAETIAARINLAKSEVVQRLEVMADKGLIFSCKTDDKIMYQAAPWVIGIYEFLGNFDIGDFYAFTSKEMVIDKSGNVDRGSQVVRVLEKIGKFIGELKLFCLKAFKHPVQPSPKCVVAVSCGVGKTV